MEMKKVIVEQMFYEDFSEHSGIEMATATKWYNGEGIDINISRKNLSDINVSLTHNDIALLRKIFSDMEIL